LKRTLFLAIWSALLVSPASAQQPIATSFNELQGEIRLGETLFITDSRGTTLEGKLSALTAASLDIRLGRDSATPPLRLTESDVNNIIVVRHDRLWDRPLIALAIGAGIAAVIEAANSRGIQKFQGGAVVGLGSLCALVGLTFDLFNKDKVTVYVQQPKSKHLESALPLLP
jgi:hypothetical protein